MNSSLTIRLPDDQRQQLSELAIKLGKTDSELVREMIERELAGRTVGQRLAHLKGKLPKRPAQKDSLSQSIKEHNWRS